MRFDRFRELYAESTILVQLECPATALKVGPRPRKGPIDQSQQNRTRTPRLGAREQSFSRRGKRVASQSARRDGTATGKPEKLATFTCRSPFNMTSCSPVEPRAPRVQGSKEMPQD